MEVTSAGHGRLAFSSTETNCWNYLDVLEDYPASIFDSIITSPPYADQQRHTYGGAPPEKYVERFLPRSAGFLRVLNSIGTFILKGGKWEGHTFVIELGLALLKQWWFVTGQFTWHKENCYPGKWPNRFRADWERVRPQFNKIRRFRINQEAVMVPMVGLGGRTIKVPG